MADGNRENNGQEVVDERAHEVALQGDLDKDDGVTVDDVRAELHLHHLVLQDGGGALVGQRPRNGPARKIDENYYITA